MALSADGSQLATVAYDLTKLNNDTRVMHRSSEIVIWDAKTGKRLRDITVGNPKDGPTFIVFTRDGKGMMVGGRDQTVTLWDVERGTKSRQITRNPNWHWSAGLSPDGKTLAVGDNEGTIHLHSVATGKSLTTPYGHR